MELNNIITSIHKSSVDISTRCQLRCVSCSTSKGLIRNGFIQEGCMKFEQFWKFINDNPQIDEIELSNWGEIFLNPDIIQILELAHLRGVVLTCGNGTNFNTVKEEILEALVVYQFKYLNISIDGASQDTYVKYRINGNFEQVISNIKKLNYYKSIYSSPFPKLSWQFIIFGHNEHEIPLVQSMCDEFGMVFNPKMNHSSFSPIINAERIKELTGLNYASRIEYEEINKKEYKHPCYQCLHSPQINWNGDVLGCCVNKWNGLGNIFQQPLQQILEGKAYQSMLNLLLGLSNDASETPCEKCPNLPKVKKTPLSMDGLKKYQNYVPAALRK